MSDEEKKTKYKNMVYRLKMINSAAYDLSSSISSLQSTMKKTLNVDDKEYGSGIINTATSDISSVTYSINNYIVPSLNKKIYS